MHASLLAPCPPLCYIEGSKGREPAWPLPHARREGDCLMMCMPAAISTDFESESGRLEELEATLRSIAQAGFSHMHWCHEWDGEYLYSVWEMEQIRNWMTRYGLRAKALHASKGSARRIDVRDRHYRRDYTSDWECCRKAGVELVRNRVDFAACIGASEIVLHLYVPYLTFQRSPQERERFYAQVEKSLDELMPYCVNRGVRICLENLFDVPEPEIRGQWDRLFLRYPASFLGICLDSGHGFITWRERLPEIVRQYASRIFAVHLHDNTGTADSHLLPGEGEIPWPELMAALRETPYTLPLTLEVVRSGEPTDVFLQRALEACGRLSDLYEQGGSSPV